MLSKALESEEYIPFKQEYIDISDEERLKLWVQKDGRILKYIPQERQTDEICKLAISEWGNSIRWVKTKDKEKIIKYIVHNIKTNGVNGLPEVSDTKEIIECVRELVLKTYVNPGIEWIDNSNYHQKLFLK